MSKQPTLEEYLRNEYREGKIDFQLRISLSLDGRVTFYIHPENQSGETYDFEVTENILSHNPDCNLSDDFRHGLILQGGDQK